MLVECTVHTGGACFIITRLLASPVQSFLLKAMDFSLAFLFSSISIYWTSQSQPYRVCRIWLQREQSELRRREIRSAMANECSLSLFSWLFSAMTSGYWHPQWALPHLPGQVLQMTLKLCLCMFVCFFFFFFLACFFSCR